MMKNAADVQRDRPRDVAQLVARLVRVEEVVGSSLAIPIYADITQLGEYIFYKDGVGSSSLSVGTGR